MHMADALLSPQVGAVMVAASGVTLAVSARKLAAETDDRRVPLMGVLGAFVFAAQMINFSIPGTGSSGHLGGGMLLMLLVGPYAAFITLASVLVVQALLFADGGILALGANVWNLGFYPCFVGGLIYRLIAGRKPAAGRLSIAAMIATVIALEMGAFSVVIETVLSGRSELPWGRFSLLMLGIHLPIGLVEGVVTVAVVNLVLRLRPQIVQENLGPGPAGAPLRVLLASFAVAALLAGGVLAWFASPHPDGLEWSLGRASGQEELPEPDSPLIAGLSRLQQHTSLLPDYDFDRAGQEEESEPGTGEHWPQVSMGASLSGLLGSITVLALAGLAGLVMVRLRGRRPDSIEPPRTSP